ncbi:MAG: hypothetical protein KC657_12180 [Myxococcales bacterium]|nr:hypothetical protein [Myxococcales bacterium]
MNRPRPLAFALGLALCGALPLLSSPAQAQPAAKPAAQPATERRQTDTYSEERRSDGDAVVSFKDDVMGASGGAPLGDIIKPTPIATRAGLMRPRFNFVGELLKSVENL